MRLHQRLETRLIGDPNGLNTDFVQLHPGPSVVCESGAFLPNCRGKVHSRGQTHDCTGFSAQYELPLTLRLAVGHASSL
jgi:hypothetical protein